MILLGCDIKLQVYGYARRFAKIGIANALVDSLHGGLNSDGLVSASIALRAVAVNVSFQIWLESKRLHLSIEKKKKKKLFSLHTIERVVDTIRTLLLNSY